MSWRTVPLGDLCEVEIGRTPSRGSPSLWDDKRETTNVWLSIADLPSGEVRPEVGDSKEYVSDLGAAGCKIVRAGALLVSFKLTLGRLAFASRDLRTNEAIAALTPKTNTVLKEYLYWYLTYFDWQTAAAGDEKIKGKTFNKAKLLALPVLLPTVSEQERIVAILDEVFEGISIATANAEKKLELAQLLFDRELELVFDHLRATAPQKTLAEVAREFGRGKSKHRPRNDPSLYGGPYPFIQTGDVSRCDHLIEAHEQMYSERGLAQSKLWPEGTVCISIVGAKIAETGMLTFKACFPDSVIGLVPNEAEADGGYIEYMLQSFRLELRAKGKGTARHNINLATFEGERFPFPPVDVQRKVRDRLDRVRHARREVSVATTSSLSSIADLKQSILARAFAGQITAVRERAA